MKANPTTKAEASVIRYGTWAGCPEGTRYSPSCCAAGIWTGGRGSMHTQCSRKPGHGPDGLYCKPHATELFPTGAETWFETSKHGWEIKEVQVVDATEKTIRLVSGTSSRRVNRKNEWNCYWPTREEATAYLVQRAKGRLQVAERDAKELTKVLKEIQPSANTNCHEHAPLN